VIAPIAWVGGRPLGRPWLALGLASAVTAAVLLAPAYLLLRASQSGPGVWGSLLDSTSLLALGRTALLAVTVTLGAAALGVPAAWLTERTDLPWRRTWAVLLVLPLAVPSFVGGFVLVSAFAPRGMLQELLSPLGVEELPSLYGFPGAWLALTLLGYPYIYIPVCAALRRIDPALEEASRSLGKSSRETFLRVTLPQLRPAISAGAILLSLYVLSEFGAVSMLHYDTLTPLVYIQYTSSFDRSAAAVLALPLLGFAALFVLLDGMTRGLARYHGRAPSRPAGRARLGAWRWPAALFCLVPTALGIGVPVAVIGYWLVRGLAEGETTRFVAEAVLNSAEVSAVAALLTVAASLPVALLAVRRRGRLSGLLEKAAYSGQAVPGITIALSLVFFSARYLAPIYQTLGLLVFAYAVRFLPEALGACRSALVQVNPHTEEVARGLGAGPVRTFLRVTAPQMLPGMSAGGLLVFLTAMKELPITLLLSPIGFVTLTTQIWSATSEAFFTRAALPSLLLVLLSAGAAVLISRRSAFEQ
jgi:iron(III) transport system permease protein